MKKLLVLLDTDDLRIINIFKKQFLKEEITVTLKGIEVWEVDEENNMVQRI